MISSAIAQSLTPVAASTSGFSWTWVIIIGLVVLGVAGFIYLKHKNPAAAATVSADAAHVGSVVTAGFAKLGDLIEKKLAPAPAAAPSDQTAALAQVTAERDALQAKLDDIKAKLA